MINAIEVLPDQFINWAKVKSIVFIDKLDDDEHRHVIVDFEGSGMADYGRVTEEWEMEVKRALRGKQNGSAGF